MMLRQYRVLLALNLIFCSIGFLTKQLPAWRMFEKAEPLDFRLTDAHGAIIDIRDFLPGDAHITALKQLAPILSFICEHERERAPLHFSERFSKTEIEVNPADCHATL